MAKLVDRLPMLVELRKEDHHVIRAKTNDPVKDRNGSNTNMLALDLRFFAIADYYLKHDVDSFKSQLSEAAELCNSLFLRYDEGEPIDDSLVSMLSHKSLFNALAANNMDVAKRLASNMGGRDVLEKKYDHPFDYVMGYTLRAFVLNDSDEMKKWLPKLVVACEKSKTTDFTGYAQVFQGILEKNSLLANEGFQLLIRGHLRLTKWNRIFANSVDEILCVWGIGMANLAVSHQLQIEAIPPLIPGDLLIG
ncbi:hypothetical protein [Gimesia sp.]|uniref:hypothetical protein n=1 Tax=Gimesia sp. TaxID=2024833 RepID=UPI003A8E473F